MRLKVNFYSQGFRLTRVQYNCAIISEQIGWLPIRRAYFILKIMILNVSMILTLPTANICIYNTLCPIEEIPKLSLPDDKCPGMIYTQ